MRVTTKISTVTTAMLLLALAMTSLAQNGEQPKPFSKIKISNFGCVNEQYYRGAQPKKGDFQALKEFGIKTIIDLRDDRRQESQELAEAARLKYVHIPMDDRNKPADAQVQEFMKIANDPANQPVFVHCAGGRHRTGLVTAVYRMEKDGWDIQQAYAEMKKYDFSYGYGHGDLKDYVFDYYSARQEPDTVGTSTSVGSSKKK